jgi:hypothetical protein
VQRHQAAVGDEHDVVGAQTGEPPSDGARIGREAELVQKLGHGCGILTRGLAHTHAPRVPGVKWTLAAANVEVPAGAAMVSM